MFPSHLHHPRTLRWTLGLLAPAVWMAAGAPGCHHAAPTAPVPVLAIVPATQPQMFTGSRFRITIPPHWTSQPGGHKEAVLTLVPAQNPDQASIEFDVPAMPPHIPGLIPMGMVEKGYVDDLRKRHPDLNVAESSPRTVKGAAARFVRITWAGGGTDLALIVIHGDQIYILSADANAATYESTRAAFESMATSLEWSK